MTVEEIFGKWSLKENSKQASVDMWNSMAQSFGEHEVASFEDENFLQLLMKHDVLKKDSIVLDVGCGTSKYVPVNAKRLSTESKLIAISLRKKKKI